MVDLIGKQRVAYPLYIIQQFGIGTQSTVSDGVSDRPDLWAFGVYGSVSRTLDLLKANTVSALEVQAGVVLFVPSEDVLTNAWEDR